MKKRVTVLFLIGIMLSLVARESDPSLNLEDILILGRSDTKADSLKPLEDNPEFTGNNKINSIKFEPSFNNYWIKKIEPEIDQYSFFLKLMAGNSSRRTGRLRNIWHNRKSPGILAQYYYIYQEDRDKNSYLGKQIEFDVSFIPYLFGRQIELSYEHLDCLNRHFKNYSRNYRLHSAKLTQDYTYILPQVYDIDLAWNEFSDKIVQDIEFNNYSTTKEESGEIRLITKWKPDIITPQISYNYISESSSGEMILAINEDFTNYDELGIRISAGKKRCLPSLFYSKTILPVENLSLTTRNTPYLKTFSRSELMTITRYIDNSFSIIPQKAPLNHFLVVHYENLGSFYWNFSYIYDKLNFRPSSQHYFNDGVFLCDPVFTDLWRNKLGYLYNIELQNFTFEGELSWYNYSEEILYEPNLKFDLQVTWNYRVFEAALEFACQTGRLYKTDNYLPDNTPLNLELSCKPLEWIDLVIEVDNLLNREININDAYRRISEDGIAVKGGFLIHF